MAGAYGGHDPFYTISHPPAFYEATPAQIFTSLLDMLMWQIYAILPNAIDGKRRTTAHAHEDLKRAVQDFLAALVLNLLLHVLAKSMSSSFLKTVLSILSPASRLHSRPSTYPSLPLGDPTLL